MNTLIEQTARFLSRSNSPFIREKSLNPDEIVDLMDKGEEVANAISKDSKKDPEERETALTFNLGKNKIIRAINCRTNIFGCNLNMFNHLSGY